MSMRVCITFDTYLGPAVYQQIGFGSFSQDFAVLKSLLV